MLKREYILSEDLKAPGRLLEFCGLGSAKFTEQFPACPQAALPSRKRVGRIYCLPEYSRLSSVIPLMAVVTAQQSESLLILPDEKMWANSWPTWSNGIGLDYRFLISFIFLIPFFSLLFFSLPIFN